MRRPVCHRFWIELACLSAAAALSAQTPNIRAWGYSVEGELGNGQYGIATQNIPQQVVGLQGVTAIAGGRSHTLAVRNDGTVWALGDNYYGQLGIGSYGNLSTVPVQVQGLTGVTAVAGGYYSSLALKNDGTVWAWGYNDDGELGNGSTTNSALPVQVSGLTGVAAIVASQIFNLALKKDGTVWAWGDNSYGQLGNATLSGSDVPIQVSGLSGIQVIAAGAEVSYALKSDGTVWDWGEGGLGNGSNQGSAVPVQVSGLTDVVSIAAGLALKSDGTVWTWPANSGNISESTTLVPVQIQGLSGVVAMAEGGCIIVLKTDGTVWSWGSNNFGELGTGSNQAASDMWQQTIGLNGITAIAGGAVFCLALKNDGTVWAWGDNNYGQLGNGSNAFSYLPITVAGLTGVVAVTGGGQDDPFAPGYSLALGSDGIVWSWGGNLYYELGNGNRTPTNTPGQVSGLTDIVAISTGQTNSLALRSDGTVWAWGISTYGNLGTGNTTINAETPVQVSGLTGALAIAEGGLFSLALTSDGTVWLWGDLLCCSSASSAIYVPQPVSGLTGVVALAAGNDHVLALKSDGTVWAFGDNHNGQLGNGTSGAETISTVPQPVGGLTGVVAIAAGAYDSLAIKADGTVWAWGLEDEPLEYTVPLQVSGLTGVVALAGGQLDTYALKSDGTLWAWGTNDQGELGNGNEVASDIPVPVSGLTGVVAIGSGWQHALAVLGGNLPAVTLNPRTLSFTAPGAQAITIANTGTAPLTIVNVAVAGINPGDFRAAASACLQAPLAPSQSCTLSVTFTPAAAGNRSAGLLLIANAPGSPFFVPVSGSNAQEFSIAGGGLLNAASYLSVAPGSIATVFGSFPLASPVAAKAVPLPTQLSGLTLEFSGVPNAPLFYASASQVNLQVPWELGAQSTATLSASVNGQTSAAQTVGLAEFAPGIFAMNGQGTGQGAILDAQNVLVDAGNPATPGSVVQIFCTGLGIVYPQQATGAPAPASPLAATVYAPSVLIAGEPATVLFSGLAPGTVGEYQVNVQIPPDSATGTAVPVAIAIGGALSNTVTMAIH